MNQTRCKPGDRAKVINSQNQQNIGLIVVVVEKYTDGEKVNGVTWMHDGNAWVVATICEPVISWAKQEGFRVNRTAVLNDAFLLPLDDKDGGITRKASRTKHKSASKPATPTMLTKAEKTV